MFVLDQDPGAVWDWIRRVVAPFDKLKTLIHNFIVRPPPGAGRTEINQLIDTKERMKHKVYEYRVSLRNKASEYRDLRAVRRARTIREARRQTLFNDFKKECKGSLSDEEIIAICNRHLRVEDEPTVEEPPAVEVAEATAG